MGVKMVDRRTDGTQRRPLGALTFPGVPVSFLPRSPMAAMTAKYWMTLLVLTVFPAPDSPLGVGGGGGSEFWRWSWGAGGGGGISPHTWGGTHVMRMDWFSRSGGTRRATSGPAAAPPAPQTPPKKGTGVKLWGRGCPRGGPYLSACSGRRYLRWRRCEEELRSASCPGRRPPPQRCIPAATCRG